MRTTVGPLPPAVYWRRRVVVLGAVLVAVLLLYVSCGGEDDVTRRGTGAAPQVPTAGPASATPEQEPSFSDATPNGGPNLPDPSELQSQPAPGTGTNPAAPANPSAPAGATGNDANAAATGGACADTELAVAPVPAAAAVKRGAPLALKLRIKNVSARACTRDLGAGAQELYLDQGARQYWSSDTCSADRSANPLRMQPGGEYEFAVTWNGRQTSKCTAALAAGPAPPPGRYELRGRLGTKVSEPVTLAIVD